MLPIIPFWTKVVGGVVAAIGAGWGIMKVVDKPGTLAPLVIVPTGPEPPSSWPALPPGFVGTTGLTSYLSNQFILAVDAMADYFRSRGAHIVSDDLFAIFLAESNCDPRIANSIGCAGLNQICNLKGVGWTGTVKEYTSLPGEQQLAYVRRYFDNVNRYPAIVNVGSLYLSNFSPAFLGKPQNFHMYTKGVDKAYALNAGVDTGAKGYIEVADMDKFVRRSVLGRSLPKFNELRGRLAQLKASGNV